MSENKKPTQEVVDLLTADDLEWITFIARKEYERIELTILSTAAREYENMLQRLENTLRKAEKEGNAVP